MAKKLSFGTYIKDELAIVYPKFPVSENATVSQKVWVFIKQDCIAYFAPVRLVWRAIKKIVRRPPLKPTEKLS